MLTGSVNDNQKKKRIFLSYCRADSDIATLIREKLEPLIEDEFTFSQDVRDVGYRESFREFMQSIQEHEFVLMVISDRYIKSLNCMYEVTEVLKDNHYARKLLIMVLGETDRKYLRGETAENIAAAVYSAKGQGGYIKYWQSKELELDEIIAEIGDPVYAQTQVDEKRKIMKILLDMPEFFRYLRDAMALSLDQHIAGNFREILKILKPEDTRSL